jgi:A/G-specific adenine glycosylase
LTVNDSLPSQKLDQIRSRVLEWYRHHQRDLPWRGESSPYRVWISEVMLQQTQVVTVIPYYQRFLETFPTVYDLALASLDEVLKVWEGLGYYSRARNLHKAAIDIVNKYEGRLPDTHRALLELPGFGEYTAAAVASIVFSEPVPAIDGNTRRVLARLFAIDQDVHHGDGARQIKKIARALVDTHRPGDWTQALIELGAVICLPQTPQCPACPVNSLCTARERGLESELPRTPPKKVRPHYDVTAAVIYNSGKYLITKRPLDGMLGGLWEFPGGKQQVGETLEECVEREIREELGLAIEIRAPIISVRHSYSHFRITLHAFYCRLIDGVPETLEVADWRWVTLDEMAAYPFPRTDQKIIAALKK